MRSAAILALTGGGIMARYATRVLEDLHDLRLSLTGPSHPAGPLRECFDLMAGTSAGALCVAGLVAGRTPKELSALFDEHGPKIFPAGSLLRQARWALTTKYSTRPLHAAVDAALDGGNPRLGELRHNVAFPALDESEGVPVVFTNLDRSHHDITLRDAVLASAAAPTYFRAHRIPALGNRRHVDGGLFANAPDLAALTLSRQVWPDLGIDEIHIVSIGTTTDTARSPYGADHPGARGIFSWMGRPPARLLKATLRAQVDHAVALLPELGLADFIRIDAHLPSAAGERLELDNASGAARGRLEQAGAKALAALSESDRARLNTLLGRRRAGPARSG